MHCDYKARGAQCPEKHSSRTNQEEHGRRGQIEGYYLLAWRQLVTHHGDVAVAHAQLVAPKGGGQDDQQNAGRRDAGGDYIK